MKKKINKNNNNWMNEYLEKEEKLLFELLSEVDGFRPVMNLLSKHIDTFRVNNMFNQLFFKIFQHQEEDKKVAPLPPLIHNYFSADYELGAGLLSKSNNWQGNPYFKGFIAFDQQKRGLYLNMHEDQDSDVPYQFSTSLITTPFSQTPDTNITFDFIYLSPGRCWELGAAAFFIQIPLHIPETAQYNGSVTIDGKIVDLWVFIETLYIYEGEIRVGVDASTYDDEEGVAVVFVNIFSPLYPVTGIYFKFRNFNPARPDPSMYAAPPPPCPYFIPPPDEWKKY